MADEMVRCIHCITLIAFLICLGCGKSPEVAVAIPNSDVQTAKRSVNNVASATDVVSQFLDQVRRGGQDSGAGDLLTEKARIELHRIGRSIEPIGSPDARFQVTRAENVPGEEGSALVHSVWSEPDGNGGQSDYQVVWAVVREPAGWRISGLAMELDPNQQPVIIDFENAELMAKMLGASDQGASDSGKSIEVTPSQAAAPEAGISR